MPFTFCNGLTFRFESEALFYFFIQDNVVNIGRALSDNDKISEENSAATG